MKIERLRLSGFKSFVDNTELHIEPGLTGIVGPNGCGKSNVLEGLRWVMGATSAKALRGKGMEDVIFAGTAGRPARNMAEVTLLLDNSTRKAPAAFNESDTLEVSRRIERDAGSAYRINGKDVRARDVQLLFADASTGSNSPALVRQGQISELINAKPENRRKILEEAAGISGLHSRRHEAELRLRAAENNLVRLEDVEQQLEDQLAGLKRQARQATRYRNLSGHIRRAEAMGLHLKWTHANDALEASTIKLSQIEYQVSEYTNESAAASTAQAEAAEKLPPLREAEAAAAAGVHRLNVERENLDREEEQALEQARILENRLGQTAQDLEREQHMVSDANQVTERLTEEKQSLESQHAGQQSALEASQEKAEQVREALNVRESELESLTEKAASLRAQRNALEQSIEEAQDRYARTRNHQANAEAELEKLKQEETDISRAGELAAHVEKAKEAATQSEDKARDADSARLAALAAEKEARGPMQEAERGLNKLKAEARALSDLLKVNEGGLWPPVIDALTAEAGYETALAAALGDDLNAPMDNAAPVHWDLLEGEPAGGAAALPSEVTPLSSYVEGPAHLMRRLRQVGVVSKDVGKAMQARLAAGQRLVSVEGDVWRWDGLTSSAEAKTPAATRLAQKNRLAELDTEIEEAAKIAQEAQNRFEAASQDANLKTRAEEEARAAWRAAQVALSQARDEQSAFEKTTAQTNSRLMAIGDAIKRLEEALSEVTEKREQAEKDLAALGTSDAFEARIKAQKVTVNEWRATLSEQSAAYEGLKRDAAAREQRLAAIAREQEEWGSRVANASKQIEALKTRQEQLKEDAKRVAEIPGAIEEKRKSLLDAISDADAKRSEAADALAQAEAHLSQCDARLSECQTTLSTAREERARIEATLEGSKERLEEVKARVHEVLECAPADLLEKAEHKEGDDLPDLEQIETKLERLKRERENMGAVNLRAEEEAVELRERLDEMANERADLEGAIAKLRKGIGELNREGRERLLAAFEQVNTEFKRLFTVLFNGGEAELQLTESDDPLSAGLEIFARPPGKRLQNMSLMSGGEQALTAVALIFAVFLANPAPICFLDEVDAPLDDANVERFCDLLDEMIASTDTRFLVITHHALTMSRMNRLYGVTMIERGISQLVSVDLSGATQIRAAG